MSALAGERVAGVLPESPGLLAENRLQRDDVAALERALRDCEAERRTLFETSTCGRAYVDPASERVLQVNQRLTELAGRRAEDLVGTCWLDLLQVEDRIRHRRELERLRRGYVREVVFTASCQAHDGTTFAVRVWLAVVRDESWRPLRTLLTIEERDERRSTPIAADAELDPGPLAQAPRRT